MLILSQGKKIAADGSLQDLDYARNNWIPGKTPSRATVMRWWKVGLNGVRLKLARVGRTYMVKKEWLAEFFEEVAENDQPKPIAHAAPVTAEDLARVGL